MFRQRRIESNSPALACPIANTMVRTIMIAFATQRISRPLSSAMTTRAIPCSARLLSLPRDRSLRRVASEEFQNRSSFFDQLSTIHYRYFEFVSPMPETTTLSQAQRIGGVLAPVVTPFKADLSPDAARFVRHCQWLLSNNSGLAPFGTTCEANSMSAEERMKLLDTLVAAGIDPSRMMPGTGC